MVIRDAHIKQFVIDAGMVTRSELAAAERDAASLGISLDRALVQRGTMTHDDVCRMQAYLAGIPYVSLANRSIDARVLTRIPEPLARAHQMVAFEQRDHTLSVALLDLSSLELLEELRASFDGHIIPHVTDTHSMRQALRQYQSLLRSEFGASIAREAAACAPDDMLGDGSAPARMVDMLLQHAAAQRASDIYIESHERETLVRYRMRGTLRGAMVLPPPAARAAASRFKELAAITESDGYASAGRFRADIGGVQFICRVSITPTVHGEQVVVRLTADGCSGYSLEGLGLHGDALEHVHAALHRRDGLILAAGERASGRTTTLYTLLDLLNTPETSISTIEHSVEHVLPRINQTSVDSVPGRSLAENISMLRRGNPDVIMVSELADADAAAAAVAAALSGTTVVSAVSAPSSGAALELLTKFGIDEDVVAAACPLVIGQRLVRRLAASDDTYVLSAAERERYARVADLDRVLSALKNSRSVPHDATWNSIRFRRPVASKEHPDGYAGRTALFEVLPVTAPIRTALGDGASPAQITRIAAAGGMLTMIEDGIYKAALGLTTLDEVITH